MKRIATRLLPVMFTGVLLSACGSAESEETIELTVEAQEMTTGEETSKEEPLRMAVASILSIQEMNEQYGPFVSYLEKKLDRPVELMQRQTYGEIYELFENGDADLGMVCAYLGTLGKDTGKMEIAATPVMNGRDDFTSYIIVPAESENRSLADLEGASFAFSDELSYSGYLYTAYELEQLDETPDTFFERTYYTYSHDNTVAAVANGLVEGGSVHSGVYDQMQEVGSPLTEKTTIIGEGQNVGNSPIVFRSDLDDDLKEDLTSYLMAMDGSAEGENTLDAMDADKFIEPEPGMFQPVRLMMDEVGGTADETYYSVD
ncbi:phosphate/phosphite/phosphonate ABC transporter substrate-binding protein [Salisediminibacterium halotolerans]|uniref:Phosphonate transport system substrate-binding protein n=1 Tax=Salisediminibacterium halotolerans TaxID=517425 RepID=A0A1H9U7S6_9BACI|nr:phosphate/phosphite/phosphonate ABC transporter substrate-binding protein [Salisediminibacterium haloalkalitolerans]SES05526.1 phosphonate transport system substrate-binding protein [Salisediminibacterium haloalkalitolerans]